MNINQMLGKGKGIPKKDGSGKGRKLNFNRGGCFTKKPTLGFSGVELKEEVEIKD